VPAYVELPVDGSESIKVEVSSEGIVRAGASDVIGKAAERLDDAVARVVRMGQDAVRKAREVPEPPDSIEVELGLKLTARTGFVIAESSGEATFKVTLKWKGTGDSSAAG
jgi:hypothetical protein